jgi:hypothetical protein
VKFEFKNLGEFYSEGSESSLSKTTRVQWKFNACFTFHIVPINLPASQEVPKILLLRLKLLLILQSFPDVAKLRNLILLSFEDSRTETAKIPTKFQGFQDR